MSDSVTPSSLSDGLGHRWGLLETSLKFHASCRHTHPGADAFLLLLKNMTPLPLIRSDERSFLWVVCSVSGV